MAINTSTYFKSYDDGFTKEELYIKIFEKLLTEHSDKCLDYIALLRINKFDYKLTVFQIEMGENNARHE